METKRQVVGWILLIGMLFFGIPIPGTMGSLPEASGSMMMGMPGEPPDFCAPTIMTVQDGPWDAPATWDLGRIPNAGDNVEIHHTVTLRTTDGIAWTVCVHYGKLIFQPNVNTRLTVVNLVVEHDMTTGQMGELQIGTPAAPIAANVTAEVIFRDVPLNTGMIDPTTGQYMPPATGVPDPEQFGNGLIGHGKVTIHGAIKNPTFVRLAVEPLAGNITLTLSQPVTGWLPGDRLILPDTRQLALGLGLARNQRQWEELTIQNVSGSVITLTSPLQYDHKGARDGNGTLEFLPHIGNLTRNVVLRSENPAGTRGHVIFMHRAEVDVRYALSKDMGRTTANLLDSTTFDASDNVTHIGTNQIGRYPIHLHHVDGPFPASPSGYQFQWIGNAVDNVGNTVGSTPKWGYTIHASHFGLVKDNVAYNCRGAGFTTEDGSETGNVIEHNFAVRGQGDGAAPDDQRRNKGVTDFGHEGSGFWFRGSNNYIRNNVAANGNWNSFMVYPFPVQNRPVRIPLFAGADINDPAQTTSYLINSPALEFSGNEAYGAAQRGFEFWVIGPSNNLPYTITNSVVWHTRLGALEPWYVQNVLIDGLIVRGDPQILPIARDVLPFEGGEAKGVLTRGSHPGSLIIRNANIQGMLEGTKVSIGNIFFYRDNILSIEDSYVRNVTNLEVGTGSGNNRPTHTTIRNVKFDPQPGYPLSNIKRDSPRSKNKIMLDEAMVIAYNQQPGKDFQLFYNPEQDPSFIVPQTDPVAGIIGSPDAGLTNAQNWATYGIAMAGAVATCSDTTTYPEMTNVFTCPGSQGPPGPDVTPPVISNITATSITSSSATITWTTNELADSRVMYGLTTSLLSSTPLDHTLVISHSVTLNGLTPSTVYYYHVMSMDASGNMAASNIRNFTTTAGGGGSLPVISNIAVSSITSSGATITWTTNVTADSQVMYGTTASLGSATTPNPTLVINHNVALSGLTANTTYFFHVMSMDASGNMAASNISNFTTTAGGSGGAPLISNVTISSRTYHSATINWTTNVPATSQVGYGSHDELNANADTLTPFDPTLVTSHSVILTNLASGFNYHYRPYSANSAGNLRIATHYNFTLQQDPNRVDRAAPVISGVAVSTTATSATITWTTDEQSISEVDYDVSGNPLNRGRSASPLVTNHSITLAGLAPNTTYAYRVVSRDYEGNTRNAQSATFTTGSGTGNQAPVVNAGPDQTIILPNSFALNGTATDDGLPNPPGALTYSWMMMSGPAGGTVTFANPAVLRTTATFSVAGSYDLMITADDGAVQSTDMATFTVLPATPLPLPPSITSQPSNQTVTAGQTATFSIVATGTAPLTYQWQKNLANIAGATGTTYTTPATTTADTGSTYRCTVTNSAGSATSTLATLTVNAPVPPPQPVNKAPVVNAGPDQTIRLPNPVTLNGTATDDGLPNPPGALTYNWMMMSGPAGGTVTFANPLALQTTATFSVAGSYDLMIMADDTALQSTDMATITVLPGPVPPPQPVNKAPVVTVSAGQPVVSIGEAATGLNRATFQGTVTDDGLPNPPGRVTTLWAVVSGPGTVTFSNPTVLQTAATFSVPGTYTIKLKADDGALTGSATIRITVGPIVNPTLPPPTGTTPPGTPRSGTGTPATQGTTLRR